MKTVRRARRGLSGAELSDRTQNIGGDREAWNIETEPKLPLETRRSRISQNLGSEVRSLEDID